MTAAIQTREPIELVAGDTWSWTKSLGDYPAPTWTLTYYLRSREGETSFAAAASGADHLVTVTAATTAAYKAGRYGWTAVATSGSERHTVETGELVVLPDPAATGAGQDPRTHARKVLEAIEAVIESRASSTQRELVAYTIGSRSQTFDAEENKASLLELHSKYKWLVANEEARARVASGLSNPRDIRIRFGQS